MRADRRRLELLYVLNFALLVTHEIDSAYWQEWKLFGLPGGIQLFLVLNLALILAFVLYGFFLAQGRPEFRLPVSLGVIALMLPLSLLQGQLSLRILAAFPKAGSDESVLREFIERVWNEGDLDAVTAYVAPGYTIHSDPGDPWEGQTLDRDAFRFRLAASRGPFPDLCFRLDELVSGQGRVAASWTMHGTQRGALGALEASGRVIEVRGLTIYYFEGGMITGHRQVVDRLTVMAQLGLAGSS